MHKPESRTSIAFLCALFLTISASAQTYSELVDFNENTAVAPSTPLVQGIDGDLYGTTQYGGTGTCFNGAAYGCGVVFRLSHAGFRVIYNFQANGLYYPGGRLVLGDDGSFYGTTPIPEGLGTIYKITTAGDLTTVYTFSSGPSGYGPSGGVTQGADGNFYGITTYDGAPSNFCPTGCGTVFKMTPAGVLTTLYSFCPQNYCPDGDHPSSALAQGANGDFYGTTGSGGLYKLGTIFKISPKGNFTLLYTFENYQPVGGLILATDGNFYGMASNNSIYRITPEGMFTALGGGFNGSSPSVPIQGTDGNLYWTVETIGGDNNGGVYEVALSGEGLLQLYDFAGYPNDGSDPLSSLAQGTDGKFYGVTYTGGSFPCNYALPGCGTIFSLDTGLQPFVAFVRGAARVGRTFSLLGQEFTGTTRVAINGIPASFTVKSDTFLEATVPAGATTGYVTVTTPSGTLTSNVPFYVIK
jgi:uncharacterized repeat protein (TIGR03803 family)